MLKYKLVQLQSDSNAFHFYKFHANLFYNDRIYVCRTAPDLLYVLLCVQVGTSADQVPACVQVNRFSPSSLYP